MQKEAEKRMEKKEKKRIADKEKTESQLQIRKINLTRDKN